ncbi:alkaline phosphatase family protein [Chloroflexota bacterium]
MASREVSALTPTFGFKQLAAAFGAGESLNSGCFAHYNFSPEKSPYRILRNIPTSLLSMAYGLRLPINGLFRYLLLPRTSMSRRIPLEMTPFFSKDTRPYPADAPLIRSLVERQLEHHFIFAPEVKDNDSAYALLQNIIGKNALPPILMVHFPSLDQLTHEYGAGAAEVRRKLRDLDDMVKNIIDLANEAGVIVFSDHGMVAIEKTVDINKVITQAGKPEKDFVYFVDAITARCWFLRDGVKPKMLDILSREKGGRLIESPTLELREFFGDICLAAHPGYIYYPNFFDLSRPKSMHGYAVEASRPSPLDGILFIHNLSGITVPARLKMSGLYEILNKVIAML